MTLSEKIKSVRVKRGISLRRLAREVGVSASFLCQLENGKTGSSLSTLGSLANALGVSLSFLVDEGIEVSPAQEDFSVTLPNSHRYLTALCDFVRRILGAHGYSREECEEAMVVVDELASSIIMHAYAPEVSDIYSVSLHFRDKGVEIVFNDKGKPYDPSKAFEATGSPGERTLSQKILQAFCDEIHYSYDSVTGNTLKVFKRHGDPKAKGRDRAGTVKSEA